MNPRRPGDEEPRMRPARPAGAHAGVGPDTTLAVAGKGGVGKTTLAALLVRSLVEAGVTPILAVDADPNSNLGQVLGLEAMLTVGGLRERAFSGPQAERERPAGWDARAWVEYRMQEAVAEGEGFDLLVMGRPEGPGCYCYANSLLREYLHTLAGGYRCVVVDNEAGLEHLSRRLCLAVDVLFVVDDGSPRARQAAERILHLAHEVQVLPRSAVQVTNGTRPQLTARGVPAKAAGGGARDEGAGDPCAAASFLPSAVVPYDESLAVADAEGQTVFSLPAHSPALQAVRHLMEAHILTDERAQGGMNSDESVV